MRDKKFTDQEKKILLENPNILKVGDTQVTYSSEFKLKAMKEYNNGKMPIQIFIEAEINIDILGRKNAQRALKRWKETVKKHGEAGLTEDQRGKSPNGGRPRIKELSTEEQLRKAEARIAYLEAENDFLKKLKALERGLI
jgi:transposase-like protein